MPKLTDEGIDLIRTFLDDTEECNGHPDYCPCPVHYNARVMQEDEYTGDPQSYSDEIDEWVNTVMDLGDIYDD